MPAAVPKNPRGETLGNDRSRGPQRDQIMVRGPAMDHRGSPTPDQR